MEEQDSWIAHFCAMPGHEYFCEVSDDFIEDDFNLTGLNQMVPNYKQALEMILDVEASSDEEDDPEDDEYDSRQYYSGRRYRNRANVNIEAIHANAQLLYGLIHQRFITSRNGIQVMYYKYAHNHFGHCPRVNCGFARTIPCGFSDVPGVDTVKLFCPSCLDIYVPPNNRFLRIDGAFFGSTFPSLFLMSYPELDVSGPHPGATGTKGVQKKVKEKTEGSSRVINGVVEANFAPGLGKGNIYDMKIYGFKVSEKAKSGPRMKWLRDRPEDMKELDEVENFSNQDSRYVVDVSNNAREENSDVTMQDDEIAGR
ncbi:hypothetical protein BJ508DRAFT_319164 [Ascobolus immersus RN42]|uniref:Casein kinase II subunit beta n=1 Tax=Ascobolus immersus RN42 TaxID=1160509 RepID=A0A3N4HX32_ASCIM|nr:hypothetical protein BJ508DRAFT_319164 [Ascobolus immersus RN42]